MNTDVMFSKASDEWETPQALFNELDCEFGFELDVAATRENSKCIDYMTADDDWSEPWRGVCWMNPPYSKIWAFMKKATTDVAEHGCTVVALVPSRTDTRWWHEFVWDTQFNHPRRYVEIRFIKGRLKFGNSENPAPFPSVVIIFRPVTND